MTKTRSHQIDNRLADGANSPVRADALLLARGLVSSRDRARDLIAAGKVIADGMLVKKPAKMLALDSDIEITGMVNPWVSRAGLKLAGGLDAFPVVDIAGKLALDIGASTGGFTDVLLAHRAAHVIAVDVGSGQLHPRLAADPRVTVMDGVNARYLDASMLPAAPAVLVCDASFISLKKLLPAALGLAAPAAFLVALIKPQFEVGKGRVGKGGVVRDAALHRDVVADIETWLVGMMGWQHIGTMPSPIDGPDGNREFLLIGQKAGADQSS